MYMYKEDLASNNQQWLICHKTKLLFDGISTFVGYFLPKIFILTLICFVFFLS